MVPTSRATEVASEMAPAVHFSAVRARLTPDGLFCQWLPLHQLDLDTLRSLVRSFVTVFPNARSAVNCFALDPNG